MNAIKLEVILFLLLSNAAWAEAPEWTRSTERRVIGGDIIHWGTGEADTAEVALFKARHMAIKTLIEECGGIANKDIIPRKQYAEPRPYGYRAWARVSLSFESCEAGKKPGARGLENQKTAEGQKLYDKLLGLTKDSDETKKTEQEILDSLRSNAEVKDEQIGALREEIAALRAEIHQTPPQVAPVALPATSSMKVMCNSQYEMMRHRLMVHAQEFNGNVAAPELWDEFNAAQSQGAMCARIK